MSLSNITSNGYWNEFLIDSNDIEFLYNFLLDIELPQSSSELLGALIKNRIEISANNRSQNQQQHETVYFPKDSHQIGNRLVFPALGWEETGVVESIREGFNPEESSFSVVSVKMQDGSTRMFASALENHPLNDQNPDRAQDIQTSISDKIHKYHADLLEKLENALIENPDLILVADKWFPKSLLVDINQGYLNLAEAILDEHQGGPLTVASILKSIELPTDTNQNLTEFSLNYALQEDDRFDEVGPAGKTLWFLKRLEPEYVQTPPQQLLFEPFELKEDFHSEMLDQFSKNIVDELLPARHHHNQPGDKTTIALLYPHWRTGTLPLGGNLSCFFPTSYESSRILFTFRDKNTKKEFSGWVVRKERYVYGLSDWYCENDIQPGSLITLEKNAEPGIVWISVEKKRPSKDYIKTPLVGADGVVVFADLRQSVSTVVDPRMAIAIPDPKAMDNIWVKTNGSYASTEKNIRQIMHSISRLNPQGNVHAEELYAALNTIRRCPPDVLLSILETSSWASHLGDLYFRFSDIEGTQNE